MRKLRGGYTNNDRLPIVGDRVLKDGIIQIVTAITPDGRVTLDDGTEINPDLLELNVDEDLSGIDSQGSDHSLEGIEFPEDESVEQEDSDGTIPPLDSLEDDGQTDDGANSDSMHSNEDSTVSVVQSETANTTGASDRISMGGKYRKTKRKKRKSKRKIRWNNKASIAVLATTMAIDNSPPIAEEPVLNPDPAGGKKTKRRKLTARKKPHSLKKRIR